MKPEPNETPSLLEDPIFEDALKYDVFGLFAMIGIVYVFVWAVRTKLKEKPL